MHPRFDLTLLVIHALILIVLAKDPLVERISINKNNKTSNASLNELLPDIDKNILNTTAIKDNSVDNAPASKHQTDLYSSTASSSTKSPLIISNTVYHRKHTNNSNDAIYARTFATTRSPTQIHNFTHTTPSHPKLNHSHKYNILQYVLIPVGCVMFIVTLLFVVRHIQRVKKKRRLERELLHQYSYPNSEAGDLDEEERFLEVESVINTQFHISSNQEDKNFVDEIPEVSVNIGEGSKLVIQDSHQPLLEDGETSTSFNC